MQMTTHYIYNKVTRVLALAGCCVMAGVVCAQRPKAVDLGLSVQWANMNVGASSPEEYGDYFAWGDVASKRYYGGYSTSKYIKVHEGLTFYKKYNYVKFTDKGSVTDNLLSLEECDDAATKQMGKEWRMPTEKEMNELLEKCTLTPAKLNGTRGFWVKNPEVDNDSIFLPFAGYKDYGARRYFPGTQCYYWTSTLLQADSLSSVMKDVNAAGVQVGSALCLKYGGGAPVVDFMDRLKGCAVRAVRK